MASQKRLAPNQRVSGAVGDFMEGPAKRRRRQRLFGHIIQAVGERRYLVRFNNGEEKECASNILKVESALTSLPPDMPMPAVTTVRGGRAFEEGEGDPDLPDVDEAEDLPTLRPEEEEAEVAEEERNEIRGSCHKALVIVWNLEQAPRKSSELGTGHRGQRDSKHVRSSTYCPTLTWVMYVHMTDAHPYYLHILVTGLFQSSVLNLYGTWNSPKRGAQGLATEHLVQDVLNILRQNSNLVQIPRPRRIVCELQMLCICY